MELGALSPLPGTDRGSLLTNLSDCVNALQNVGSGDPVSHLRAYQEWSNSAVRMLVNQLTDESLAALICTRRYWALQTWPGNGNQGDSKSFVDIEIQERKTALQSAQNALVRLGAQWKESTKALVVADTNVYLHQPVEFWRMDWKALVGSDDIRVFLPIVVAREIDKAKRLTGNVAGRGSQPVRTRSRLTTKWLNELFEDPNSPVEDGDRFEIELVFDGADHRPLDRPDEEIIDRAVAVKSLTGRDVLIATRDMTMQLMARRARLTVVRTDGGEGEAS